MSAFLVTSLWKYCTLDRTDNLYIYIYIYIYNSLNAYLYKRCLHMYSNMIGLITCALDIGPLFGKGISLVCYLMETFMWHMFVFFSNDIKVDLCTLYSHCPYAQSFSFWLNKLTLYFAKVNCDDTWRPKQNGRPFANDTFKLLFQNKNCIWLKFHWNIFEDSNWQ